MATYWIRGLNQFVTNVSVTYFVCAYIRQIALFLEHVVGYTFQSQSTASGDYRTTDKHGTAGSLTGSSWVLTDSSAPFSSTDGGKWILIKDTANPENCGVYWVHQYLSSTTIVVDWQCDSLQYPLASSNVEWWIFSGTNLPNGINDYIRYKSPHANPAWAVELKAYNNGDNAMVVVGVAPTGNWSDGRLLSGAAACRQSAGILYRPCYQQRVVVADSNGNSLFIVTPQYENNADLFGGRGDWAAVGMVTPVESGLQPYECVALTGPPYNGNWTVIHDVGRWSYVSYSPGPGTTRIWSDKEWHQLYCYLASYTSDWVDKSFPYPKTTVVTNIWRENNARIDRMELTPGTYLIDALSKDYTVDMFENAGQHYQIIGRLNGHWSTRGSMAKFQPLSTDGIHMNRMHLNFGIVVEWPAHFTSMELVKFWFTGYVPYP